MLVAMWVLGQGVPPEIAGIPSWVLNGLSIGTMVAMFFVGLMTDKIWTRGQVSRLQSTHDREVKNLVDGHTREVQNLVDGHKEEIQALRERYETHIQRTVEMWQGRADDAVRRETDWKQIALDWQKVATVLSDAVDPLHAQSATTLEIVRQLQANQAQQRRRT